MAIDKLAYCNIQKYIHLVIYFRFASQTKIHIQRLHRTTKVQQASRTPADRHFRLLSTGGVLAVSDFCAPLTAMSVAISLRLLEDPALPLMDYVQLLPALVAFPLLYALLGLYPGILRAPCEELKRLSLGSSMGFLFLSFLFFLWQQGVFFSRFIIIFSWLLTLFLAPFFRYLVRRLCSRLAWWGYPVLVFAPPEVTERGLGLIFSDPSSGLFLAGRLALTPTGELAASPDQQTLMTELQKKYPDAIAGIIAGSLPPEKVQTLVLLAGKRFRRIMVSLDILWLDQISLHMVESPFGPALALRQNLLDPKKMRLKRCLDLLLCLGAAPFCLLLMPLAALCIKLDSKGPVLFRHKRIGCGGRPFFLYKFRTMVANAREVLDKALEEDEDLRNEWRRTQKLVHDPRLTRVGRFLRRTSLDELPQIFNVLRGEMSIVGPRPIVEAEIERYSDAFDLYERVRPGITGLWQVSGRNDLSYARRVELDRYYVYNWQVWLDIYIIVRTIPTIVSGRGAY